MSLVVISRQKLDGMGRHHRQLEPCRQLHGCRHMALVVSPPSALKLHVEAMGKDASEFQRQAGSSCFIPFEQRLPHRPGLRPRKRYQAFGQFLQPCPSAHRQVFDDVFRPCPGEQL